MFFCKGRYRLKWGIVLFCSFHPCHIEQALSDTYIEYIWINPLTHSLTHRSEVHNVLQHEAYPRGRLPFLDNFFHLIEILVHPRLREERGNEEVNLRHEGCILNVSIESNRLSGLQGFPHYFTKLTDWSVCHSERPDRPRLNWNNLGEMVQLKL